MGLFDNLYHLDWTARYPLQYYYNDGRHVNFDKYEIDMFGNIYNNKSGQCLAYRKSVGYATINVCDSSGGRCAIRVARAVVSTFHGKPPTIEHTTEHIDCTNKDNDIVCELTWMDPSGQVKNRIDSGERLNANIISNGGVEMTIKEWVKYLKDEKNSYGREYTENAIKMYAIRKQHGFSYKIYEDLPGEIWYHVVNSDNKMGYWEISNQNRIAYISKHSRNVIDVTRFGFSGKYPKICINGKSRLLHDVAFEAYYPDEYASMKTGEMILHKFDDTLDFRPHVLRIGTMSENAKDAHDNGCYNGAKTSRISCVSYVNGVLEKHHDSLEDAEKYLRTNGYLKADYSAIGKILKIKDKVLIRYGRTWSES